MKAGMNPTELARRIKTSRQNIYRWEKDEGNPGETNLKALAKVLKVSVPYLRDGVEDGRELDYDLLLEILVMVDARALDRGISLTNRQRAAIATALYRSAAVAGDVDDRLVSIMLDGLITA